MAKETLPQGEVDALVREFETKLARLRNVYEQYFMGMERIPPNTLRKDVVRLARRLDNLFIRNTAGKFKVRSLIQRFNTYKVYWDRVVRQIEEGTYVRDIQKARRNQRNRKKKEEVEDVLAVGQSEDGAFELDIDVDIDLDDLDLQALAQDALGSVQLDEVIEANAKREPDENSPVRPSTEQHNPTDLLTQEESPIQELDAVARARAEKLARLKRRMKPNPKDIRGVSVEKEERIRKAKEKLRQSGAQKTPTITPEDKEARRVFNALVAAKKKCNESTSNLNYDELKRTLAKQKTLLKETRGAKDVNFNVVIKDGKAFLKPELKK